MFLHYASYGIGLNISNYMPLCSHFITDIHWTMYGRFVVYNFKLEEK